MGYGDLGGLECGQIDNVDLFLLTGVAMAVYGHPYSGFIGQQFGQDYDTMSLSLVNVV